MGKGIRVVIDYMRQDASPGQIKEILSEKPKFEDGMEPYVLAKLHSGQMEFLAEHGISIGTEEGAEKYSQLGKGVRAILDYAMRTEAEGDSNKISEMYETVRCLNC